MGIAIFIYNDAIMKIKQIDQYRWRIPRAGAMHETWGLTDINQVVSVAHNAGLSNMVAKMKPLEVIKG